MCLAREQPTHLATRREGARRGRPACGLALALTLTLTLALALALTLTRPSP